MDSPEDDFVKVELEACNAWPLRSQVSMSFTPEGRPGAPLTRSRLHQLLDADGRLVDEHALRQETFIGGIEADVRADVWRFLFELYPVCSTYREREAMSIDYLAQYLAMKERWRQFVTEENPDLGSSSEDKLLSPCYLENIADSCEISARPPMVNSEASAQWPVIYLPAKINASRHEFDGKSFVTAVRIIDKDVPRTDRSHTMFSGTTNPNLRVLRDILVTFAAYHPEVGYAQGMNDIAARFLVVLKSEVEAYWCFSHYMQHVKSDFVEDGVLTKLGHVQQLLKELDPYLLRYLETLEVGDMTFCHRWMLLCFKREFNNEDSLKCFEMLSCHHLEVDSMQAKRKLETAQQKTFEREGGDVRLAEASLNVDFTFDVFMCVAILLLHRDTLLACIETSEVFALICNLALKLHLDETMQKAEELFHQYCKKSASESFELLDFDKVLARRPSNKRNLFGTKT